MAKEQKAIKYVFVRDDEQTKTGISSVEAARELAAAIPETEDRRVRVRLRSRTGLWDVVVKVRREDKSEPKAVQPETQAS